MRVKDATGAEYKAGTWTNEDVYIEVEGAGTTYSVSGANTVSKTAAATIIKNPGESTVVLETKAGNNVKTEEYIVKIDKSRPKINSLTKENGDLTNQGVIITGSAIDELSGITGYMFTTDSNITATSQGWKTVISTKDEIIPSETITENGTYYFYVVDAAGNVEQKEIVVDNIDKDSPTDKAPTATSTTNSVTVKVEQTDDQGITKTEVSIKYPDGTWSDWIEIEGNEHTFEGLDKDTEYEVKTKVTDTSGNETESKPTKVTTGDLTKPVITAPTDKTNKDVEVTITYPNIDGVKNYYSTDGENWIEVQGDEIKITVSENNTTIYAKIEDKTGQTSETATWEVTCIDKESPKIISVTKEPETPTNQDVTLIGKAIDQQGGIVGYQFSQDANLNENSSGWTNITSTTTEMTVDKKVSENGTYYFYVVDGAGNVAKQEIVVDNIDKNSPTNTAPTATSTTNSITVKIEQEDENGIVKKEVAIKYPDGTWSDWIEIGNNTHTFEGLEMDTEYQVKSKVTDKAGNVQESEITTIRTKKIEKPVITASSDWTNTGVDVLIKFPEVENIVKQYSLDGINWIVAEELEKVINVTQNNTTVYARVINEFGQAGEIVTYTVTSIDNTPPNIKRFEKNTNELTKENIILTAVAQDEQSGIVAYQFSIEQNLTKESSGWIGVESTQSEVTKNDEIKENGRYYFYVMDAAGNVTSASIVVNNIDKTAPNDTKPTLSATTNSITVKVEQTDNNGVTKREVAIREKGKNTWSNWIEISGDKYTFEDLDMNKDYEVKTRAEDEVGNSQESQISEIKTVNLDKPIISADTKMTNQDVEVTINYPDIEGITRWYSTDGTNWQTTTSKVQKITVSENNTIVYAKITDSTNQTSETATWEVTNIDKSIPELNSIAVTNPNSGTYSIGQEVVVVATYSENIQGTVPVLKIKFGDGQERTLSTGTIANNTITYKYTIVGNDYGKLQTTSYTGTLQDAVGNVLDVSNKQISGNEITAYTKPLLKIGVDFRNTIPNTTTAVVFTDEVAPAGITLTDVSEQNNGSVVAWMDGTTYKVSTQNVGLKAIASSNSKKMFGYSENDAEFATRPAITSIDMTNLDINNVTDMSYLFSYVELTNLVFPQNFNTSKTTTMYAMFRGTKLSSLDYIVANPGFVTDNVTNMAYMFHKCDNLTNIDLSKFYTPVLEQTVEMFSYATKLKTLTFSDKFETSNVNAMNAMFKECSSLTSISFSDKFITNNVSNMKGMFENCILLSNLDVSGFNTSNVTNMYAMFKGCQSLTNIDVSNWNTSSVSNMSHLFNECKSLTTLDVSNFNTENVINMAYMFSKCENLTNLNLGNMDTSNVEDMEGMFYASTALTALDITSFDTSKVTNMYSMFNGCSNLKSLDLTSFSFDATPSVERMFSNTSNLSTEILIDNPNITSYENMFYLAATVSPAEIVLDFTDETESLVDAMVATKWDANANVHKKDKIKPEKQAPSLVATTNSIVATFNQTDNIAIDKATRAYVIRVKNGTWGEWINSNTDKYTFTNLDKDVEYEVKTKVSDTSGNEQESDVASIKTVNLPKPTITASNEWVTDSVTVTITFPQVEGASGEYSLDGSKWTVADGTILVFDVLQNNTTVYARLIDGTGQVSETATYQVTCIDPDAPAINSLSANPNGATNQNVVLTGKATDNVSGIVAYQFSTSDGITKNSSGWNNIVNTKAQITQTYTVTTNDEYYFYVKDEAGNVAKQKIVINYIDKTAPTLDSINVTSPATGAYSIGQEIKIVATYSENITGTVPVLKIKFGSGAERTISTGTINGKTIEYTYKIVADDNGVLTSTSYTGIVTDLVGNSLTVSNKTLGGNKITASNTSAYSIVYKTKSGIELGTSSATFNFGTTNTITPKTFTGYQTPAAQNVVWDSLTPKTITFTYEPIVYTISYTLNDATLNNQVTSYTIETNTFTIGSPTKTGYTFNGWTGTNITTPQTSITIPKGSTGNKSYTANFTPDTYTIVYNSNGGTGTMSSQTIQYNSLVTISTNQFKKNGYTFVGWTTKTDNTDDQYKWTGWSGTWNHIDGQYGIENKTLTLYARWEPVTYNITVDLAGGSGASSTTYTPDTNTFAIAIPTKKGYIFNGWKDSQLGLNGTIPNTIQTDSLSNVLTFSNSKSGNNYSGIKIQLWDSNGTYLTQMAASTSSYTNTYTHNYDTGTYRLRFGTNGSTQDNCFDYYVTLEKGKTYRYGWTVDSFSSQKAVVRDVVFYTEGEAVVGIPTNVIAKGSYGDRTLVAQWTPETYTVVYNANGSEGTVASQTIKFDEKITIATGGFTRRGYDWAGWTTRTDNVNDGYGWSTSAGAGWSGTWKYVNGEYGITNNTLTLYPRWTPKKYTITYNANGGTGTMDSHQATYDSSIKIKDNTYTKTGYTFVGWTTKSDGTDDGNGWSKSTGEGWSGTWTYIDGQYGIVNQTLPLYARWRENTYQVAYNANGGTGTMANSLHTYNVALNLTANTFTRAGYTFNGWNTKADGTGTAYANSASVKNLTVTDGTTVTLYAQWKEIVAYAVYSSTDNSLTFYKNSDTVTAGNTYNGKVATAIFRGVETTNYTGAPWGDYKSLITNVKFNDVISPISTSYWFFELTSCTSIDFTNLDTSNVTMMVHMFEGSSKLTSLDVSKFNTSNVTNMLNMFYNCSKLTSLNVSSFNTSKVTSMRKMFSGCTGLTSLDLSNFNTTNVTDMYGMFSGNTNLTSLNISSFDTSNVTTMGYMFKGCKNLNSLDVSDFNTAKVTHMGYMFSGCEKLTQIDVSNFNTQSVTKSYHMFSNCYELKSLDLSNFDTANYASKINIFSGCRKLEKVKLGSKFNFHGTITGDVGGSTSTGNDYLPTPSSTYITGANGKWYNTSGTGYDPSAVPSNVADTYYAVAPDVLTPTITGDSTWVPDSVDVTITYPSITGATYQYSTNGTNWSTSTTVVKEVNVTVNNTTVYARVIAPSGQVSKVATYQVTCIDPDAPVINSLTADKTSATNQNVVLTGKAIDTLSGIVGFQFSTNASLTAGSSGWTSLSNIKTQIEKTYTASSNNDYYFYVKDGAGNLTKQKITINYIDKTAPSKPTYDAYFIDTQEKYTSGDWTNKGVHTKISSTDSQSAITELWYSPDGVNGWQKLPLGISGGVVKSGTTYYGIENWSLMNRNNSYYFKAKDAAGNESAISDKFQICYDITAPSKPTYDAYFTSDSSKKYTSGTVANEEVRTKISSVDEHSGVVAMYYSKDNQQTWSKFNFKVSEGISNSGTTYSGVENWSLTDRNDTFYFKAVDDAGNESVVSDKYVIWYDVTKPTLSSINVTSPATGTYSAGQAVTIVATYSENIKGTAPVLKIKFGSGAERTATAGAISGNTITYTYVIQGLDNGVLATTSYTGSVQDTVGNNLTVTNKTIGGNKITANTDPILAASTNFRDTIPSTATAILFTDEVAPNGVTTTDVSKDKNGTVVAWLDGTTYKVSSQRSGVQIIASADCSKLFGYSSSESGYETRPAITSIDMTNLNINNVTNMSYLFSYYGLTNLVFPSGFNTSKVTNMYGMFRGVKLTSLDYIVANSGFITSNVTNMAYMFEESPTLMSLNLGNFNTSKVTSMEKMFYNCGSLESITFSNNFITSSVTNMSSMFGRCNMLETLDLSSFNTSKVTSMYLMFGYCTSLLSLDLSSFDTSLVTDMRHMFTQCVNLGNINVSSFNTSSATTMESMFYMCEKISSLDLSSFNTVNVTSMSHMFTGCISLTTLDVSSFNTANVTLMQSMFYNCTSLTSITGLNKFDTSKVENMCLMFQLDYNLASLDLSSFDTSNVQTKQGMFNECRKLSQVILGSKFKFLGETTDTIGGVERTGDDYLPIPRSAYITGATGKWYNTAEAVFAPSEIPNNVADTYTAIPPDPVMTTGSNFNATIPDTATSVVFTDVVAPSSATDVSAKGNETVMAWLDGTTYKVSTQRSGVKVIANADSSSMFASKANLTTVDVANLDTSVVTNMSNMFYYCTGITSLDLSTFNTSNVTNMERMFRNMPALTSLNISNFNTSKVTSMNAMFWNCNSLTTLDVSMFNTANVIDMRDMFTECSNLTTLEVSNWDTKKVTTMEHMFYDCNKLEAIDVSNWNTTNVTNMYYMFNACESLGGVDISNWDTSNVTDMGYMFDGCKTLIELDMSKWNTSKVKHMGYMFYNCINLQSINVSNFNTTKVEKMYNMFENCSLLEELDLSSFDTTNIPNKINMFKGCTKLQKVTFGSKFNFHGTITGDVGGEQVTSHDYLPVPSSTYIPGATGYWYNKAGVKYSQSTIPNNVADTYTVLPPEPIMTTGQAFYPTIPATATKVVFTDVTAPSSATLTDVSAAKNGSVVAWLDGTTYKVSSQRSGVKIIANEDSSYMFYQNAVITGVDFTNLDTSRVKNMKYMFYYCTGITSLDLSTFNTSNVINMERMFRKLTSLTSLDVSKFDTSNITNMQALFQECSALASLNVSSFDTSNVTDMSHMFQQCSALTSLDLSNFDTSNVTTMLSMFNSCTKLTSLDLSSFDTSKVTNMYSMFGGCRGFKTIELDNFNTANVTDMGYMFVSCTGLTSLDVSSFNTAKVTNMEKMFQYTSSLTKINGLTSFNTAKVTNMNGMFGESIKLQKLDLSKFNMSAITDMGAMFDGDVKLQEIKVGANFKFVGTNGYFPTPSSTYITGADGKWYSSNSSNSYAPSAVPNNKADTYFASLSGKEPSVDITPTTVSMVAKNSKTIKAVLENADNWTVTKYQWYYNTSNTAGSGTTTGSSSASLAFKPTAAGTYYVSCVVTCTYGSTTRTLKTPTCKVTVSAANYSILKSSTTTYYNTLSSAISAAVSGGGSDGGGTIKMLNSLTDDTGTTVSKTITLDTNGKTLTRTESRFTVTAGTLTVTGGGTIKSTAELSILRGKGGNIKVTGGTYIKTAGNGIYTYEDYNSTVTITDSYVHSTDSTAIYAYAVGNITITDSYILADTDSASCIRIRETAGASNLTISGASRVGNGVHNDDGTVSIAVRLDCTGKLSVSGTSWLSAGPYGGHCVGLYGSNTASFTGSSRAYAVSTEDTNRTVVRAFSDNCSVTFNSDGYFYSAGAYVAYGSSSTKLATTITKGNFGSRHNKYMVYDAGTQKVAGSNATSRTFRYLNTYKATAEKSISSTYYYGKGV